MRPLVRLLSCTAVSLSLICWSGCNATNSKSGIQDTPMSIQVTGSFPVGVVGQTYPAQKTAVLTVTGGTAPYTWSIATGSFPKGLTLNSSTGEVSGTPTEAGQQFGFTVQVEDAKTQTVTQGISITIDTPMTLSTTPPPASIAGANYSFSLTVSGGTWPFTEKVLSGVLPPGLSLNGSTGAIAGVPTTPGTYSFTIQITDSENVSVTTGPLAITIAQLTQLSIPAISFPAATAGVPYGPVALNAAGGIPPYSWTMTSGSAPGLSIFEVGLAGTPAVAGTDQFTLTVTDSAAKPNSASQPYSLTVNPGGGTYACGTASGNESMMSGPWAFLVNGFDNSGSAFAVAGSFTADGKGGITAGEEDYNDAAVGPSNLTFDTKNSSYFIDANGRGCLNLVTSGTNNVYSFVLNSSPSAATKGRIIEFDDLDKTAGTARVTGILRPQTSSAFALTSLQPNYAFGVTGWDASAPFAMAGSFTVDTSGNITSGYADTDSQSTTKSATGITGSIGTPAADTGRATLQYVLPAPLPTFNFVIYIVNQNEFFMVDEDTIIQLSAGVPLSSGEAIITSTGLTAASLSGGYILQTAGYFVGSTPGADVTIGQLTFDGVSAVGGTLFEDQAGTSSTNAVSNTTATYSVGSGGRVATHYVGNILPVIYLTTPTDGIAGFLVGADTSSSGGVMEQQTAGSYSTGSIAGNYIVGTGQLGDSTGPIAQLGTIDFASGAVGNGLLDESLPGAGGLLLNQAFNPVFSVNSDGTATAGADTAAVTNGTTVYYIDETSGKDPAILVIEQ